MKKNMKLIIQVFTMILILVCCSACGADITVDDSSSVIGDEVEIENSEAHGETESKDEIIDDEEEENNVAIDAIDGENVLDGINASNLFSLTLGEVIDLLGPGHSEPRFASGSTCIEYPGSCIIYYHGAIEKDKEPQIELDGIITAISIFQEVDVYKGISVGKTLDQLNSNKDLKNKFEIDFGGGLGYPPAAGGNYEYNGKYISIWIDFDENLISSELFLKLEMNYEPTPYDLEI